MSKTIEAQPATEQASMPTNYKRLYFVEGVEGGIEATDAIEAVELAKKKQASKNKDVSNG